MNKSVQIRQSSFFLRTFLLDNHLEFEHIVLQFPLKLQEAADGQFSFQVFPEEVGGEGGATAASLQGVSRGGAVSVPHAHTGLRPNNALDLKWVEITMMSDRVTNKVSLFSFFYSS